MISNLTQISTQHMIGLKRRETQLTIGIGKVIRLVGLIQPLISIGDLYLSGRWFSANLRTDIKRHVFQRDWNM